MGDTPDTGADPRLEHVRRLQAVGPLVASLTHDINNPIAAILGAAYMLKTERDPDKIAKFAELVNTQAKAARDLIQSFETLTSSNPARTVVIDADELTAGIMLARGMEFITTGVSVQRVTGSGVQVAADSEQLRTALSALLDNAIEATAGQADRQITIECLPIGDLLAIEVRDNGPGIAPELHEQVFDPHYTSRRSGKGLGLGLPTALGIMQRHGGDVVIHPDGPGCRVQLRLPIAG